MLLTVILNHIPYCPLNSAREFRGAHIYLLELASSSGFRTFLPCDRLTTRPILQSQRALENDVQRSVQFTTNQANQTAVKLRKIFPST